MYIYQNSQKYNQQDLCRLSLLFFFAEIRRCLFGAPCSRRIGSFVLYHRNPLHLQRKIGFGKPKILVTVFQMLKCERTGNLYKHAHSLHELCRTCAERKKLEVHTSLMVPKVFEPLKFYCIWLAFVMSIWLLSNVLSEPGR